MLGHKWGISRKLGGSVAVAGLLLACSSSTSSPAPTSTAAVAASVAVYGTYVPQAAPAVDGALDWVDFQDNARFNASREACSAGACTSNPETGTYAIDEGTITFTDDDGTAHSEPFAVPAAADSGSLATQGVGAGGLVGGGGGIVSGGGALLNQQSNVLIQNVGYGLLTCGAAGFCSKIACPPPFRSVAGNCGWMIGQRWMDADGICCSN